MTDDGLFLGLLSGTSVDAIDAALVRFPATGIELVATHSQPILDEIRAELLTLGQGGVINLDRLGAIDAILGELFADAAMTLLPAGAVTAIGCHGLTLRHRPGSDTPFTLQIGDPNRVAERTGLPVVADFRRRDIAAGGEGAPLTPAFHQAVFASPGRARAILNLGGIANLTLIDEAGEISLGSDTGPANALLDSWATAHLGEAIDQRGRWASGGRVHEDFLGEMLADPWFAHAMPKSTGREQFNLAWIEGRIGRYSIPPEDVQATLLELTARTVAKALDSQECEVFCCGGGVHNDALMGRLRELLAPRPVRITADAGLDPDWVEAAAFAWLAREHLAGRPANCPIATGASRPVVLGALYPGLRAPPTSSPAS